MDYDNWKLESPPEEKENDCLYCGEPCDTDFCDKACQKAYESDN